MGTNFERSPQGEGNPFRASYSAFLSSVFDQATAAASSDTAAATTTGSGDDASTTDLSQSQSYTETLSLGSQSSVNTYSVTKSGSSLPPSTFATATSSTGTRTQSPNSNTASATAHAESNSSASVSHAHDSDDGLSHGELAAAIVVPILVSLAFIAFAIMCLRRRSRTKRERERTSSDASRGTRTSFFGAGWKEKWGSIRSSASSQHKEPVVTSHSNNAYMTGLDTSSRSNSSQYQHPSGEYYAPPPPYILAPELPPLATHNTNISLPTSRRPSSVGHGHELSDLPSPISHHDIPSPTSHLDPPSPTSHLDLPTPSPAFLDSSARSINSDVYSETASVHSARAARMSIGGPIGVETVLHTSRSRANMAGKRNSDPFDDPNTPVSGLTPTGSAMGQYMVDEDGRERGSA